MKYLSKFNNLAIVHGTWGCCAHSIHYGTKTILKFILAKGPENAAFVLLSYFVLNINISTTYKAMALASTCIWQLVCSIQYIVI